MKTPEDKFLSKVVAMKLDDRNAYLCKEAINAGPFIYGLTLSKEIVQIFFDYPPYFRFYGFQIKEPSSEQTKDNAKQNNLNNYDGLVMRSANVFELKIIINSLEKLSHSCPPNENEEDVYHYICSTLKYALDNFKFEIYLCGQIFLTQSDIP